MHVHEFEDEAFVAGVAERRELRQRHATDVQEGRWCVRVVCLCVCCLLVRVLFVVRVLFACACVVFLCMCCLLVHVLFACARVVCLFMCCLLVHVLRHTHKHTDLRQDMLTLQIMKIMDDIWQKNGLDLRFEKE